jgi:hypothetical protein
MRALVHFVHNAAAASGFLNPLVEMAENRPLAPRIGGRVGGLLLCS